MQTMLWSGREGGKGSAHGEMTPGGLGTERGPLDCPRPG